MAEHVFSSNEYAYRADDRCGMAILRHRHKSDPGDGDWTTCASTAVAAEVLHLAESLREAEELLGNVAPVLAVLRPLFEERAGAWERMGHTAPEQITLAARFSVQELRQALGAGEAEEARA